MKTKTITQQQKRDIAYKTMGIYDKKGIALNLYDTLHKINKYGVYNDTD